MKLQKILIKQTIYFVFHGFAFEYLAQNNYLVQG